MNKLLIGALALSLAGGAVTAASAQTYDHDRGQYGGYDNRDHRGDERGRDNDRGDGYRSHGWRDHHRGRTVCTIRHHHRVCYRQHW